MSFSRYAIFYLPPAGALADFGATWLGWDVAAGQPVRHPDMPGLDDVTGSPRRYGFHGTLKPPFRLADGTDLSGLQRAVARMATTCPPGQAQGLTLSRLGRFLALVPLGKAVEIARVAATCVEALDGFRAPMDAVELARRRKFGLSDRQDALLRRWGYPYVMEEFRFHLTLTDRLPVAQIALWTERALSVMPELPAPFVLDAVALVGERQDGRFELIRRYALGG
ncbi:DUF1045 domain-containing protein [Thalassococcus sp. CAU 1522]|uniref:DUF1045 domain-containing protein n=1 Tax=Thalassococcus arenae TaxID=2851652 RepID=A0ABS6NBW1_9RHOB|nr:DUF1045 domain-containing protein [Thalassococcus arenae]MBV2361516.1 DUF1045 domain-containing protein [Thalassococcus arenae]